MPISEKHLDYAQQFASRLRQERLRVELDARNEKIGLKIREAQLQHVPYMLVAGDKEAAGGTVSLRTRKGGDQGSLTQDAAIARIRDAVASRAHEG
jgi:threonyl-tRNA synthetase